MDSYFKRLFSTSKESIALINRLDNAKFQRVLTRMALETLKNAEFDCDKIFNLEERELVMQKLEVDSGQLLVLLRITFLIFSQIIYFMEKPETVEAVLKNSLRLNDDKASSFALVWSSNAKQIFQNIKQKQICCCQVDNISWLVNIESSSNSKQENFEAKALFQITLKPSQNRSIDLDLSEQQVFSFYSVLENIQSSLDSLSAM